MTIGVLKEPGKETRASLLPEHVVLLKKHLVNVMVEHNVGVNAYAADAQYQTAGATVGSRNEVLQTADIILSISPLSNEDIAACKAKILF